METVIDGRYLYRKAIRTDDTSGNRGEVNPSNKHKFSDYEFTEGNIVVYLSTVRASNSNS